jgi:hypothetical protein
MAKISKRSKLASKAGPKTASATSATSSAAVQPPMPIQRTKDSKRIAKHDAFLKSPLLPCPLSHLPLYLFILFSSLNENILWHAEINSKTSTKRKRPKKQKPIPNLLSLNSSLVDIISQDKEARSKRQEISRPLKGNEIKMEVVRMKSVMEHPAFRGSGLKAIREHILNTWEKKEGMA